MGFLDRFFTSQKIKEDNIVSFDRLLETEKWQR